MKWRKIVAQTTIRQSTLSIVLPVQGQVVPRQRKQKQELKQTVDNALLAFMGSYAYRHEAS